MSHTWAIGTEKGMGKEVKLERWEKLDLEASQKVFILFCRLSEDYAEEWERWRNLDHLQGL